VYRQIEVADKNFMNQVGLVPLMPYNIPAGSLTGQVGGYGPQVINAKGMPGGSGAPMTLADPFYYQ